MDICNYSSLAINKQIQESKEKQADVRNETTSRSTQRRVACKEPCERKERHLGIFNELCNAVKLHLVLKRTVSDARGEPVSVLLRCNLLLRFFDKRVEDALVHEHALGCTAELQKSRDR
jgi:hypothetical protein